MRNGQTKEIDKGRSGQLSYSSLLFMDPKLYLLLTVSLFYGIHNNKRRIQESYSYILILYYPHIGEQPANNQRSLS